MKKAMETATYSIGDFKGTTTLYYILEVYQDYKDDFLQK